MPSYHLSVLDLNVSFKAEADPQRIQDAKDLVEERFRRLDFDGSRISKEKLLIFLALGLADDLLQSNRDLATLEEQLDRILAKIEGV
ncbi:MAG: cell division protein ZapA [Desulfovibrionaceae bacterium]